jgi:hypothetical protein
VFQREGLGILPIRAVSGCSVGAGRIWTVASDARHLLPCAVRGMVHFIPYPGLRLLRLSSCVGEPLLRIQ